MMALVLAINVLASASAQQQWHDSRVPPAQRAASLLAAMNATEKLVLLHGAGGPGIG
eukprot:SAG11_NODE_36870_length_259_cov_1.150000_1_plen_56_part_10